ncbi:hypothetical protein [Burkholderia aenigmatica]|uniref:hypothetical protein n=1 Tax=Burkholderia aenigmatica TaxID=2015348 RepID=UPI00117893D4|nr:hypothetical protein [Burkholderia aenigmatica]
MNLLVYFAHAFMGAGPPRRNALNLCVYGLPAEIWQAQQIEQRVDMVSVQELLAVQVEPNSVFPILHLIDLQLLRTRGFEYARAEL